MTDLDQIIQINSMRGELREFFVLASIDRSLIRSCPWPIIELATYTD